MCFKDFVFKAKVLRRTFVGLRNGLHPLPVDLGIPRQDLLLPLLEVREGVPRQARHGARERIFASLSPLRHARRL